MSSLFGDSHLTRERRPILSLEGGSKRRHETAQHGSAERRQFTEGLDEAQVWEADLWVALRRFQHLRKQSGLFGERRLRRRDADDALRRELKAAFADTVAA